MTTIKYIFLYFFSISLMGMNPILAVANTLEQPQISAASPVYRFVQKVPDETITVLNHIQKPVFKVSIIGLELTIDNTDPLWTSLSQGNISEIYIEADKINLKNENKWPSANVVIVARELSINPGAKLDLSPSQEAPATPNQTGSDGKDGLPGSRLILNAKKIILNNTQADTVFLINGGSGQMPGPGEDGVNGPDAIPFPELALRVFSPAEKERYLGHLIGIEALQYKKTKICSGNMPGGRKWKSKCGKEEINYWAQGSISWPKDGSNAKPAGIPGAGGAGGRALIQTDSTNLDWPQILSTKAGANGKPRMDAKGGVAGKPTIAIIKRARNSGTDQAHYVDEVHYSQPGKDAPAPQAPNHQNPDGSFEINQLATATPSSNQYFEAKLAYIRDLYLGEQYQAAMNQLNDALTTVKANPTSYANSLFPSRLNVLKANLLLGKTYFGDDRMAVPFYSMDVNVQKLSADIEYHLSQRSFIPPFASSLHIKSKN